VFFTEARAPGAIGLERWYADTHVLGDLWSVVDEQVDNQMAVGHRLVDGHVIGAVAVADTSGADAHDRVVGVRSGHLFHVVEMFQIVEAEAHMTLCTFPAAFAGDDR
jgi:hypothetical protein